MDVHSRRNRATEVSAVVELTELFIDNSILDHIRAHKGEKNYICPVCAHPFITPADFKRHGKAIHKVSTLIEMPPSETPPKQQTQRSKATHKVS